MDCNGRTIKAGDRVKCVDGNPSISVYKGKKYTVKSVLSGRTEHQVVLEGSHNEPYASRFELIDPKESYEAVISIEIKDSDDNIYETHQYNRHAESANESEVLFWSFVDRYGKDSFFNGMEISLSLIENGRQIMDLIVKPHHK